MPSLHIAMLTHNALEFSRLCLDSLLRHTSAPFRILVLDNGSVDGTREWLLGCVAPHVQIMLSPANLGVAKGRNQLLAAILCSANAEDLIVFLDNDVEVCRDWDLAFVSAFDARPELAIAGVTGHDIVVTEAERELLPSPATGPEEVDVVSGFCLWVRAGFAGTLGPFDENLGLFWHEDDDYCVRAIGLGGSVVALPEARIVHHGHRSGAAEVEGTDQRSALNQHYLARKWRALGLVDAAGRVIRRREGNAACPSEYGR